MHPVTQDTTHSACPPASTQECVEVETALQTLLDIWKEVVTVRQAKLALLIDQVC